MKHILTALLVVASVSSASAAMHGTNYTCTKYGCWTHDTVIDESDKNKDAISQAFNTGA